MLQGGRGNALHVGGDGLEVGAVPGGNGRLEHAGLWAEVIVPWVVVRQGVAVSLTAQWTEMEWRWCVPADSEAIAVDGSVHDLGLAMVTVHEGQVRAVPALVHCSAKERRRARE